MATHSTILTREIPWTEEPGGLHPTGSQRVRHDFPTKTAHTRLAAATTFQGALARQRRESAVRPHRHLSHLPNPKPPPPILSGAVDVCALNLPPSYNTAIIRYSCFYPLHCLTGGRCTDVDLTRNRLEMAARTLCLLVLAITADNNSLLSVHSVPGTMISILTTSLI